jgi:hypothetical protein
MWFERHKVIARIKNIESSQWWPEQCRHIVGVVSDKPMVPNSIGGTKVFLTSLKRANVPNNVHSSLLVRLILNQTVQNRMHLDSLGQRLRYGHKIYAQTWPRWCQTASMTLSCYLHMASVTQFAVRWNTNWIHVIDVFEIRTFTFKIQFLCWQTWPTLRNQKKNCA